MAIEVALQTENGEVLKIVHDENNLLPRLLECTVTQEPFLTQIDWYGDTVFNRIQMPLFKAAWRRLSNNAETNDEKRLAADILELAETCEDGVHLYLKFIGD